MHKIPRPFECKYCDKVTRNFSTFEFSLWSCDLDMRRIRNIKLFFRAEIHECVWCSETWANTHRRETSQMQHMLQGLQNNTLAQFLRIYPKSKIKSPQTFAALGNMYIHIRNCHPNDLPFECHICSEVYYSIIFLNNNNSSLLHFEI